MSKNVLIISQTSPFDQNSLKEALDVALIYAAIDQQVSWLFTSSAVLSLQKTLNAPLLGLKDMFKQLKTLEIYDVERVYACQSAMEEFNISPHSLAVATEIKNQHEILALIKQHDFVVTL
ncbi:DsrE family protein [Pseudoalteromonas maricaloris]|uniref:DsrE family protein n=1 Tax=Pseudoalteromonas maricaloris TaxID=184924 RepID=UPI003C1E3C7D